MTKELTNIEKQQEMARRYENLAYALKSPEGLLILEEINAIEKQVKSLLYNTAMKAIPFPYEYSKEELQQQKQYRAQLEILTELLRRLNSNECMKLSSKAKKNVDHLINDVPTTASY